jgi:hypothetical protein
MRVRRTQERSREAQSPLDPVHSEHPDDNSVGPEHLIMPYLLLRRPRLDQTRRPWSGALAYLGLELLITVLRHTES